MDISQITDVNQLKALAYDEMMKLEAAQTNLRLLNSRIVELQQLEQDTKKSK
jgi:hypothetical protein